MTRTGVTGSAGFVGGYLVQELLARGHEVVGLDNHSKYGPVRRTYDDDPNYRLVEGDARKAFPHPLPAAGGLSRKRERRTSNLAREAGEVGAAGAG